MKCIRVFMVDRWWESQPHEIYWIEITDRPDIGVNLKAPQSSNSGHFLMKEVKQGDIVYHYDKNKKSFVGLSYCTGELWEENIFWPHERPGWYAGLVNFEPINPIPLSRIQEDWPKISEKRAELKSMVKTAYFPFESGEKRPTRPVQGGYLCKLPRFFVQLLDGLDPGQPVTSPPRASESAQSTPSLNLVKNELVGAYGKRLEALMEAKGLTASRIANIADCSPQTITDIITGRIKNPSDEVIDKIDSAVEESENQLPNLFTDYSSESNDDREFAYEKDLQNFLSKNLDLIEPGLTLFDDGTNDGIEYPTGKRRIDLLTLDKNGDLVVIELKVSRGPDRTLGQISYYIGWIKQNIAKDGQEVRGIIIANEITDELKIACSFNHSITLKEYSLSCTIKNVS